MAHMVDEYSTTSSTSESIWQGMSWSPLAHHEKTLSNPTWYGLSKRSITKSAVESNVTVTSVGGFELT